MEKEKAVEIFNKWMDCKDAYQADPSCDGNCLSCEYYSSAEEEKEAMQMAIAALEKQAEDNEWCHDCKEYDKEQHCCHRFTKVIRQAVEDYRKEQPDSKWIPVSEALPKEKAEYNVTIEVDGSLPYVDACYWNDNDNVFEDWNGYYEDYIPVSNVIAWRPLPEPYQEDKA